jgi:hypothetical protein
MKQSDRTSRKKLPAKTFKVLETTKRHRKPFIANADSVSKHTNATYNVHSQFMLVA